MCFMDALNYDSNLQPTQDSCQFNIAPPRALDDVQQDSVVILGSDIHVDLGMTNQNFITASVAVTIGNFSFVFAAYTSNSGQHFVTGVRNILAIHCHNLFKCYIDTEIYVA